MPNRGKKMRVKDVQKLRKVVILRGWVIPKKKFRRELMYPNKLSADGLEN